MSSSLSLSHLPPDCVYINNIYLHTCNINFEIYHASTFQGYSEHLCKSRKDRYIYIYKGKVILTIKLTGLTLSSLSP